MDVCAIVNSQDQISYNAISCGSKYNAWDLFFRYHAHQYPLADAIKAYKAIGYRAVKLEIKIIELPEINTTEMEDD
jgi:hypothetical protein